MGWGFLVGGMALGTVFRPAEGLADGLGLVESWGGLAEGSGVGWWVVDMSGTSEIDAGGNDGVQVDDMEGILPVRIEL